MSKKQTVKQLVKQLDRAACTKILEEHCFQVHDNETLTQLREAIAVNIQDGTIARDFVESVL